MRILSDVGRVLGWVLACACVATAQLDNAAELEARYGKWSMPNSSSLQTAFELYDRAQAEAVAGEFRAFCKYASPPSLLTEAAAMRGESGDVVMGFASGYNAGQVVAFVHSLRAVGFNGTLVLGIESAQRHPVKSKELLKLFARYNVVAADLGNMRLMQYAQVCRYVAYYDWVQKVVPVGGRVLVSDVRDVFFQSNPFDSPQPDAAATLATPSNSTGAQLLVFEETRGSKAHRTGTATRANEYQANLYTSKLNRAWITAAYDGDPLGLPARRDYWVLCSGTTMGTREGMLEYTLRQQAEMGLCRRRQERRGKKGGDVCIGGADQAFHNVLYYRGQLPGAHAVQNGAGQVYTVGVFNKFGMTLRRDAEGFVVSDEGRRMPAVHQADKERAVVDWLFHHFHLDEDISAPNFRKQMSGGARFSHPGR